MDEIDAKFVGLMQEISQMYGMDSLCATIISALYIEPEEIAMEELAKKTGYSLASISNKIKFMEHTGIIKKETKPGTRKIFLRMEKDMLKIWREQLVKAQEVKIKVIKAKLPSIISEYKPKAKSESEKKKLKILEDFYGQITKFDTILNHMIKQLGALK